VTEINICLKLAKKIKFVSLCRHRGLLAVLADFGAIPGRCDELIR
jgi:hypothetical protein